MNTLTVSFFACLVAVAIAKPSGVWGGHGHLAVGHVVPAGPTTLIGASGVVGPNGAAGPTGVVNGHGAIGPNGEHNAIHGHGGILAGGLGLGLAGHGGAIVQPHAVVAAPIAVAAPAVAAVGIAAPAVIQHTGIAVGHAGGIAVPALVGGHGHGLGLGLGLGLGIHGGHGGW